MPHGAVQAKSWSERLSAAEACVRRWPENLEQARAEQERLRQYVVSRDDFTGPEVVAGVDVAYHRERNLATAAVSVLSVKDLRPVDASTASEPIRFPYIPGYLSFRELPAAIKAMQGLKTPPDMFLCDGQGIAHPRGLGLASHLGVLLDIPCVGVAKSRLVGTHKSVGQEKGQWRELSWKGKTVGIVLRSRTRVKPIYVSCGHRVGLSSSRDIVLSLTRKYRLPETTRQAHALSKGLDHCSAGFGRV
ncbi:MAG: deoxyribonuclease V [Desulfohalobiaceae bacterium]|nr:deoxyribonuclease V [Desulfohalobiaceae bacterium]